METPQNTANNKKSGKKALLMSVPQSTIMGS